MSSLRGFLALWLAEVLATAAGRLCWSIAVDTLVEVARSSKDGRRELEIYEALSRGTAERLRANGHSLGL